jgi:hypothetical protein
MGVRWEEDNGVKYLVADYTGVIHSVQMLRILHEYTNILRTQPGRVNCLEIYEGSFGSGEFVEEGKKLGKEVHIHKIDKNALIGVTGIKKGLLQAYLTFSGQKNVRTFSSKEEAVAWLTAD